MSHKSKNINKTKVVLLIGIPILLVLSLALMFARGNKEQTQQAISENYPSEIVTGEEITTVGDGEEVASEEEILAVAPVEQYPAEPVVLASEEKLKKAKDIADNFRRSKKFTEKSSSFGKSWEDTTVGDPADSSWRAYQPKNVQIATNKTNKTATVTWDDQNGTLKPFHYLVGYWYQTFDPMEKFQVEKLSPDQMIAFGNISQEVDGAAADAAKKTVTLNLDKFPSTANTVYFYIYKRIKLSDSKVTDYIYGANNTADQPYTGSY